MVTALLEEPIVVQSREDGLDRKEKPDTSTTLQPEPERKRLIENLATEIGEVRDALSRTSLNETQALNLLIRTERMLLTVWSTIESGILFEGEIERAERLSVFQEGLQEIQKCYNSASRSNKYEKKELVYFFNEAISSLWTACYEFKLHPETVRISIPNITSALRQYL